MDSHSLDYKNSRFIRLRNLTKWNLIMTFSNLTRPSFLTSHIKHGSIWLTVIFTTMVTIIRLVNLWCSQNSTCVSTILEERRGRKKTWDLYKRCHSYPLTSHFSWTCEDYGCVNNPCLTIGRKRGIFWRWWGSDSWIVWQLLPNFISSTSLIFIVPFPITILIYIIIYKYLKLIEGYKPLHLSL